MVDNKYFFLLINDILPLIKFNAAIKKHTLIIPKRGIRYVVTNSAPIADPIMSTLYKLDAMDEYARFLSFDATENSMPIKIATISVRRKKNVWIK
jgi:hypothetical protein